MIPTTNQKYEITDVAHEKYPFIHRVRALRDIGSEVKKGDLGGFVESEANLSFEQGDDAWIFDEAIACNNAYVDQGAVLREDAIACANAYISHGAHLSGHARAEDDSYIRGAVLCAFAQTSGVSMILASPDTHSVPILSGHCAVYGKVSGNVRLIGKAVVISGEHICNDTLDTLVIDECGSSVIRHPSRNELTPGRTTQPGSEKIKQKKEKHAHER